MTKSVQEAKKERDSRSREKYGRAFERIYRMALRIPRGRVMTYGQIARLLEDRYSPRLVGWAMHATPQDGRDIPWHRVINSRGAISTGRVIIHEPQLQRWMLEAEGVVFDERGHCDLSVYQWSPRQNKPRQKSAQQKSAQQKNTQRSRSSQKRNPARASARTKSEKTATKASRQQSSVSVGEKKSSRRKSR